MFWCKNCLNTSTRPRLPTKKASVMRASGLEKKKINWKNRQSLLKKNFNKKNNNQFDCIVPVSGVKMVLTSPIH